MPSRQDQLHSYQFMVQRVVAALVMRETDPAQSPFRRVAGATLVGVLLAVLALGGVAAFAVISPGGSGKWRNDKAVIVEKESGAIYVYRDQQLHPVLNYASALLILNTPNAATVSVSRTSITGVPRGVPWGIVGAPASLPAPRNLHGGAWTVCSHRAGGFAPQSTLFIGSAPPPGVPVDDKAVLISTVDNGLYLVWRRHKHLIRDPDTVLPGFVWVSKPRLPVAAAFVNALPAGPDLVRPVVTGRGRPVSRPAGGKVGQVYRVESDFFIVTADGLASLTPLQAKMLLADPQTSAVQAGLLTLSTAELARYTQGVTVAPFLPTAAGDAALPLDAPEVAEAGTGAMCVAVAGGAPGPISTRVGLPESPAGTTTRATSAQGGVLADRVVVAAGGGALVRSAASPGATTGSLALVTDLGIRFAVTSPSLLGALGYARVTPVALPAEIVALVPAGPALDPAVAQTQPTGTVAQTQPTGN